MRRLIFLIFIFLSSVAIAMAPKISWDNAVDKAVKKYGLRYEPELMKFFSEAGIAYPPIDIAMLAFKKEQKLELWARNGSTNWTFIHTYPLTATSGRLGPKLKERDGQIPEGIYHLTSFNPLSTMHLSMMIDYPNHFDRLQASKDGRHHLGNNIFLHGKNKSVGCLAIGDRSIDQLFLLARRVGLHNTQVIIAPNDLRKSKPETSPFAQPRWLPELYRDITQALNQFKPAYTGAVDVCAKSPSIAKCHYINNI